MNIFKRLWNRNVVATAQQLGITMPEMTIPDESVKIPYTWPDCAPPDKTNKCWEYNLGANINGTQYKMVEVSPGRWQWHVNEEIEAGKRKEDARRHELMWLMRTRVLTDAEMAEVGRYGSHLNIDEGVGYYPNEKATELNSLLLQQFQLRAIAEAAKK